MLIFLFITTVYCVANYYLYTRLSSLFNFSPILNILLGVIIAFMTISPTLLHFYSFRGTEQSVRFFSYLTYLWLAFITIFFPSAVILDLYNYFVQHSIDLFNRELDLSILSPSLTFGGPFLLSIAINGYGYFEAQNIKVERLTISSPKLSDRVKSIRVAQVADLHLGIIVRDKMLEKVINIIEGEKPDLIVSSGDMVDGVVHHIEHLSDRLKKLNAPMGKFAVVGNHELYGGVRHTLRFLQDAGFTVLRGEGKTVENMINVAGMDFMGGEAAPQRKELKQKTEREVLSELPSDIFTLLLKHRSDVERNSLGLFDLQLSGHTHKGQIFPMNLAVMFLFEHHSGFKELGKGSAIHVSRGAGTAGPPVRFLSRPELTIIDIVHDTD